MSDLFTNNPHIKQHDWDKPKEEPMVVEWIDGHKLDQVQLEDMTDDDIKALVDTLSYDKPKKSSWYCPPDPVFTTDKDGYVYIDLDTCQ